MLLTHTTQAALLPQTYSLVTGGDQARPVERKRAVIRSALFVGKEKNKFEKNWSMILSEHEWIRSVSLVSSDRGNAISMYTT